MVGETGVLTRATELVARRIPGFACIDGKGQNQFLLAEDVLADPKSAESAPLDRPGLGVDVDRARVERLRAPDGPQPG
jgi:L-alanine-DL-glutamate epimerase-like enolase superfamily enzyme